MSEPSGDPVFVISVAARLIGVHAQTLRAYEREGLVAPARSGGGVRMYSAADIERLLLIRRLMEQLGVNRAGVDVILRLTERLEEAQTEITALRDAVQRLRDRHLPAPQGPRPSMPR